jgi:FkbM family methyltransferase
MPRLLSMLVLLESARMGIDWDYVKEIGTLRWIWRTFLRQFSKRILRRDVSIVLPTGLRMRLPRNSKCATEVFISQCNVDWGSEQIFTGHLEASGVVLDVGANIGYYSLYTLPRVAAVHAFEPDPRTVAVLRQNLAAYPNAHVHTQALGNHAGTAKFVLEDSSEMSHIADSSGDGAKLHQVELTTIDRVVAELKLKVTGIKVDAEGVDIDVIEGARETLKTQAPLVLTEAHPDTRLFDLIQPLGYRVFAFVRKPKDPALRFQEIVCGDHHWTKMLFLVPPRLGEEFEKHAA